MTDFLNTIGQRVMSVFEVAGRERARRELLRLDPRLIADAGLSAQLLHEGVGAWPWRAETDQELIDAGLEARRAQKDRKREEQRAIRELRAMSNAELSDLAITRGDIEYVVRNGRGPVDTTENETEFDKVA